MTRRIRSVLIANRGEIALRLIKTFRALSVRTVLGASRADLDSPAARAADEVAELGDADPADSYLRVDRIVDAALRHGADAVHPGYGFLSERPELPRAVEERGLVYLGPTPEQVVRLGDKITARRLVGATGVSPVPGAADPLASASDAASVADRVGYPVLVKAAAGGGGKGIRVARDRAALAEAFAAASAEAERIFGSPFVYLERYVEGGRHVEIQVLGDGEGGAIVFPERDCSIQRRLQKLVEESPSPAVTAAIRERLQRAAFDVVRGTRYRGPGTFEFLLAPEGDAYFLEVNTQIQVEHPVTEMACGTDLVRDQLAIAEGRRFGSAEFDRSVYESRGHAIELRIYAEDCLADFRPSTGVITALELPSGPGLRVDSGIERGSVVSPFYDPMLAKLIAWGAERDEALGRLREAIAGSCVTGVATTLPLGAALMRDPHFVAGRYDCQHLPRRLGDPTFLAPASEPLERAALAALAALIDDERRARARPSAPIGRSASHAWNGLRGWRGQS